MTSASSASASESPGKARRPRRRIRHATLVLGAALVAGGCSAPTGEPPGPAGVGPTAGAPEASGTTATDPTGAPTPTPSGPAQVTLAFAGDVHFERQVAALLADSDAEWSRRMPELAAADFAMVNLETAITTRGRPESKSFTFRAPATALNKLKAAGVDAVSMANNHAADYGRPGVEDTLAAKKAGVLPIVGFGPDAASAYAPLTVDVKGVRTAVLAASQISEETAANWKAGEASPGIAVALDRTRLRAAVRAAAASHDLVVVKLHWGTEGSTCPNENQLATAKELEADGADIVVGTHAHRPQGSGWQGRAFVGYGTGNHVWYNTSPTSRPSGVLTVTVDAARARERGQAQGASRRTPSSLVTAYRWTPKYIATNGVPQAPERGTRGRLDALARQAPACANLRQEPAAG